MGQGVFFSALVHSLLESGGPQGFANRIRNRFAPQWPSKSSTYQYPEEWIFTVIRDVASGMHVLRKSVKHPRSLPHTCACEVRISEESKKPRLITMADTALNIERFL
jgi:hypothetical protein